MSGGSRGPTTTTVQSASSAPWEPMRQPIIDNMQAARAFYDSDTANRVYQGTTVIPFSQQSTQGMNFMEGVANKAMPSMQNPLTAYSGMMDTLAPIAQGDFSRDTTFNNTLGRAQQNAAQQVNMAMSGAGRYGSGAHTDRMASTIGDMTNRAMLDRQNWASGQLQQFGNAMPQAYATALAPGQTLQSIGGQYENLAANYAQEQLDKFNAPAELQRRNIMERNALLSGAGQLGGSSSGTSTIRTPGTTGSQLLGTGASAAGYMLGGK